MTMENQPGRNLKSAPDNQQIILKCPALAFLPKLYGRFSKISNIDLMNFNYT